MATTDTAAKQQIGVHVNTNAKATNAIVDGHDADELGCGKNTMLQHIIQTTASQPTQQQQNAVYEAESSAAETADEDAVLVACNQLATVPTAVALNKKLLLCQRFKDTQGFLRNFNSLPLFVYATSSSTLATSADGVGVAKEAAAAAAASAYGSDRRNDSPYELALCTTKTSSGIVGAVIAGGATMDCLPLSVGTSSNAMSTVSSVGVSPTAIVVGAGGVAYPHHLNLNHLSHQHHHHHLLSHHSPYSNNYPLHHSSSHHHIHSEQAKSLQELQHEVGALLEFRDLVIETFPDLKHKMASMSSAASTSATATNGAAAAAVSGAASVSGTNTLTGCMSSSSLASRREWEPGIRIKRKLSQKEPSTSTSTTTVNAATAAVAVGATAAAELSSSSLTRSRSNSHSGKKEPKSGENNNGSVVQDSGFSTETSSSKEGHSASSTNGAMNVVVGHLASNRLSCPESDDELLNLLDVIHRKSNRLREEVEQLQNYERQNLRGSTTEEETASGSGSSGDAGVGGITAAATLTKSSSGTSNASSSASASGGGLTPKTFREHVERLNKEDIKQLRRERDRLLDKLAEMEAETLTGRIKAAKMNDQVEELISVKKDLEEQLKLAMAQKLELSARVQQLQQLQSKSSSSQSDYSSQRNFLSSATTVLSTGVDSTSALGLIAAMPQRRQHTFQPVVVEQQSQQQQQHEDLQFAFHQSASSDSRQQQQQQQQQQSADALGRLDGIVSTPGTRNAKCRVADSKRFTAILLETSVIELQRHLLTLTVQNQGLMQKLEQATKSKTHLAKRLDKSKDDVEDLRFQLEEKNIELEGTKAQLRVLETRIRSATPSISSGAATNSYLPSTQNDYETNRSSASTMLMLSRRGGGGSGNSGNDSTHCSDLRSSSPSMQMPQPTATQISTPSMKAMVHLPMDELQQHGSSTESTHENEMPLVSFGSRKVRLMSSSVGGISPFEQASSPRGQQNTSKRCVNGNGSGSGVSKPSKIPLPGSKAAAYFAGKPPTGRPATAAGRTPTSANSSANSSTASNRSALSRSTGNLLYSKSPNSLKRADSVQSIRKDSNNVTSSSLSTSGGSTNTSRSSTNSSIPMATTPYNSAKSHGATATANATTTIPPSTRILQNSPLPKLKRETLTSRVRHLDSLSRVHQHANSNHHSNVSTASEPSNASPTSPTTTTTLNGSNYLVSSTPKPSTIAAQLNATLRKDLQLSASNSVTNGTQPYTTRRAATAAVGGNIASNATTTRRFSSASVLGARVAASTRNTNAELSASNGSNSNIAGAANGSDQQNAGDNDSGKVRTLKSTFLGWLKI